MRLTTACLACLLLTHASAAIAQAGSPDPEPEAPAIRRWLDVQSVHGGLRFRWYKNSEERLVSSTLQWQTQLRGRFLFDREGRYHVGALASTGATFPSSWNNTGGGIGTYQGPFNVKQLFFSAEPVRGWEVQAGGLFVNRGEMAEHLTYDNDAYIVGERVTYRPVKKRVTQVAITAGFFGGSDYNEVNVFKRFERMDEFNYGQALVGFSLHPQVAASVEYTYEDRRDIFREGVNVRMPSSVRLLTLVKFEAYQRAASGDRVHDENGYGFNISGDLRYKRLSVTAGVMSVDRHYGSPLGQPYNGDRYENGTRQYTINTYQITPELSFVLYQTEAFATDFPINLKHRVDLLMTYNPTAWLRRKGVF